MGLERFGAEAAQDDAADGGMLRGLRRQRPDRDLRRPRRRKAIGAGRNRRERDAPGAVRGSEPERFPVAALEKGLLAVAPSPPDRTDGMDDVAGRKIVGAGDAGLAGRAAAEPAAFFEEPGAGRAMDGAVHAAPAEQ